MKRLILLRHAKSDWDAGSGGDRDRPLNKRGVRDAPRVARRIAVLGWTPERVLSSDAARTRETWEHMRESLPGVPEAHFTPLLYLAGLQALRKAFAAMPPEIGTVMAIGHNPGWEEAASALVGDDVALTTCNAAMLTITADDWSGALAREGQWRLEHLLRPKELAGS
jgi:phosphohistidine phosphatase